MIFNLLKFNIKRWCVQSSDWTRLKMLNYFKGLDLCFLTTHEYKNTETKLLMLCFIHKQPSFHTHVHKNWCKSERSKDKNSSPSEFIFQEFFHLDLWSILVTNSWPSPPPLKLLHYSLIFYIILRCQLPPTITKDYFKMI